MHPERELTRLAAYKTSLRRRLGRRRAECAAAALHATRPLVWMDRALAVCRRVAPLLKLAAVPLGLALIRSLLPAAPKGLRFLPFVLALFRKT